MIKTEIDRAADKTTDPDASLPGWRTRDTGDKPNYERHVGDWCIHWDNGEWGNHGAFGGDYVHGPVLADVQREIARRFP